MKKTLLIALLIVIFVLIILFWYLVVWTPEVQADKNSRIAAFATLFSALAVVGTLSGLIIQYFNHSTVMEMNLKTGRLQFLISAFEFVAPRLEHATKEFFELKEKEINHSLSSNQKKELMEKEGIYFHLENEYKRIHAEIHCLTESVIPNQVKKMASANADQVSKHADKFIDKYMQQ